MKKQEIYHCAEGGGFIEVLQADACGEIACCGGPMKALPEQTADSATEKHVPVITEVPGGTKVTVGSVPHPMLDKHYIMMIELHDGDFVYRKFLKPGDAPEAVFPVKAAKPVARELCNIHGLWKG